MLKTIVVAVSTLLFGPTASGTLQNPKRAPDSLTLKDAFEGKFFIGTALNLDQIWERDQAAVAGVKTQFNSIIAEN